MAVGFVSPSCVAVGHLPGAAVLTDPCQYARRFQEIVDLNAANVVVGAATEKRAAKWEATIVATLAKHSASDGMTVVCVLCWPPS